MDSDKKSLALPYNNFVSPDLDIDEYKKSYNENKELVVIPNFITSELCDEIKPELENYPWFTYSFTPVDNVWGEPGHFALDSPLLQERFNECSRNRDMGNFTYRFTPLEI